MSRNVDFYEQMQSTLDSLSNCNSIELVLEQPLGLDEITALSYRLSRGCRIDQVHELTLAFKVKSDQSEECLVVLEALIERMRHLKTVFVSQLRGTDCLRILRGCKQNALTSLSVGSKTQSLEDAITADALVLLEQPEKIEKLGLAYIHGEHNEMARFGQTFEHLTSLRELSLGVSNGASAEGFESLLETIADSSCTSLKRLSLWGPDYPDDRFSLTPKSLNLLARILRNGKSTLELLSLEDLPKLFSCTNNSGPHSLAAMALQNFCTELRTHSSLTNLALEGGLGLHDNESTMLKLFEALAENRSIFTLCVKGANLSLLEGVPTILRSVGKNQYLKELSLRVNADGVPQELNSALENLHKNTSITFACIHIIPEVTGHFMHFCSRSNPSLHALSERNKWITLVKNITPCSDSFPASLLPKALEKIILAGGGCHATFPLLQKMVAGLNDRAVAPPQQHKKKLATDGSSQSRPRRRSRGN